MANMEMKIDSMRVSKMNNQWVVMLREEGEDRYLPIWVGPAEGDAISMKLEGVSPPRPLTHDFACAAIDALGGTVERVVIDRLEDTTFHAKAIVKARGGQKEIDCRPSDAMAMAVRKGVPIMAAEEVLSKAGVVLELAIGSSEPTLEGMSDEQSAT